MKKIIFTILFLFIILSLNAQDTKKYFLNILKGNALEKSITFLPFATHFNDMDFGYALYTGYNYKSFEMAIFKNSYGDATLSLTFKRQIPINKRLSIIYGIGLMYGYAGKLQNTQGIPFRKSFLFTGNINPIGGLVFEYKIAKKIGIQANIIPALIVYGFRFII